MIYHVQLGAYVEAADETELWKKVGPISEQLDTLDAEGDSAYEVVERFGPDRGHARQSVARRGTVMSDDAERYVEYDPEYRLALIRGPGGFTQVHMIEREAAAIAEALGIDYRQSGIPGCKGGDKS